MPTDSFYSTLNSLISVLLIRGLVFFHSHLFLLIFFFLFIILLKQNFIIIKIFNFFDSAFYFIPFLHLFLSSSLGHSNCEFINSLSKLSLCFNKLFFFDRWLRNFIILLPFWLGGFDLDRFLS